MNGGLRERGSKVCLVHSAELMYHHVKRQFTRKKNQNSEGPFAFFEIQILPEVSSVGWVFGQLVLGN